VAKEPARDARRTVAADAVVSRERQRIAGLIVNVSDQKTGGAIMFDRAARCYA
jgi:hypothetical protein